MFWSQTNRRFVLGMLGSAALAIASGVQARDQAKKGDTAFTIAVIPDTQNYLDFTHQAKDGFPFDAAKMFMDQMRYVADNVEAKGGDIAFVTALGDIWQHQSKPIDPEHEKRGFRRVPNPLLDHHLSPSNRVISEEMPMAREGYKLLAGLVPFSVVPGNHDYDAMWTDARQPPSANATLSDFKTLGQLHVGGLDNFRSVFGNDSDFFKGKPWYVASHDGGADSAQIFTAGGLRFLHIGLQFDAPDASLEWAAQVIRDHPGLPTIIATHDYMNNRAERRPNPALDANSLDPGDNSPQEVWDKLISKHDQIFLVLCGHQHGQSIRTDKNDAGHDVLQLLSDYQGRRQTFLDAGGKTFLDAGGKPDSWSGIGDGWFRLMRFDLGKEEPTIAVRTYSTHYKKFSRDEGKYPAWYRDHEQPGMADDKFHDMDDFVIVLKDFRARFMEGRRFAQ